MAARHPSDPGLPPIDNSPPAAHVAILSSPGIGHLTPLLELAVRLVSLHGLQATVFLITTEASAAQHHLLRPRSLPDALRLVELPPADVAASTSSDAPVGVCISRAVKASLPSLRSVLLEASPPPSALVVDIFGVDAFNVAGELHVPRYLFYTSTAASLAVALHSPALDREVAGEYVDLPGPLLVPGCRPIRPADVFDPMLDRKSEDYWCYLNLTVRFPLADGILVNTVEEIEKGPIAAMREDPAMVGIPTPQLYPVGPLIQTGASRHGSEHKCMAWLDQHPPGSVLFVSFGSGGTLSAHQTAELAWGLELSQQRFLWVVRPPTEGDSAAAFLTCGGDPDDPKNYLPDGFASRTEGRGLLVSSWAPQVDILGHSAVGGFLTHGGWNSVLESVAHGVAMIAWPLYAEQRMNAAMLEEELEVAVRVREEGGLVKREEVERVTRLLMEGEQGKAIKGRVVELRHCFATALEEGGSSNASLGQVVGRIMEKPQR